MITKEQLNIHSLKKLKQEISKTNLKGYSKLKKIDLIALMMTKPERFNHLGTHSMPNGTQMTGATHDSKSKPTKKIIKKKAKESPPPKASPPPKPKAEPKGKEKLDIQKVVDELSKQFIDDRYQDYIEMYLDGRGSEERQLDRASERVVSVIYRIIKRTAKEKKFTTDKQLIDYWLKNKKDFTDLMEDPKSKLPPTPKASPPPTPKASPPPKPKLTKEEVKKKVKKVIKKRAEAKPEPKAEESDLGSLYKHGIGNASKAELGDMFDKLSQNVNKELEKMKTAKKDYFKVIKVRGGKQYHTEAAAILVEDQKEIQKALERYIETHGIKDSGVQEMIKKFNKLANSAMTRMRKAKGKALERVGLI